MLNKVGKDWKELEEEIFRLRATDRDWSCGAFVANWPQAPGNAHLIAKEASGLFFNSMISGRRMQPSVEAISNELCDFVLSLMRAPSGAYCGLTSGGTESNILAVKAARDWARKNKPHMDKPEILMPFTGHPSFDKAADLMDLAIVRVPENDDLRGDVSAMKEAVSDNTFMIVGSAPPWPHGKIDPIPELAKLATENNIWFHADASVGAFLIPFLNKLGKDLTPFDFSVPGVRSICADMHKYGYAPTGIGALLLRDESDAAFMRFQTEPWSFGSYGVVDQLLGAKSANHVAAAWAVMKHLGEDGYLKAAQNLLDVTKKMVDGITQIDGLKLLCDSDVGAVIYTSDTLHIFEIAKAMNGRGFMTAPQHVPPGIHLMMNPLDSDTCIRNYLDALQASVVDVRNGKTVGTNFDAY